MVQIIQDSKNGLDIQEQSGCFSYTIPTDGRLRVTSLRPFESWHKESATFQDGRALLTSTDDNVPESAIAFRQLSTLTTNTVTVVRYYVGTKKEADDSR